MAIKVGVIGAGSLGFTRKLMRDILTVPELQDTEFAFTDINEHNLEMITQLAQRDIKCAGIPATVTSTMDRREALKDANYVINSTRIGGLEAFELDIDIPLKYGVDQCVGDTLCIGGIMYGQRNIPAILDFCKDIREVSKPNALFLNYANPNAMNTWAAFKYGGVRTVGLCHGVEGGHWQICKVIEHIINEGKDPEASDYVQVPREDVDIICAGINHQTWYVKVLYQGEDWCDRLLEGFETHPTYQNTEKVRIDMLRRFGYYSTESNGHLSEYVPWYRKNAEEIQRWVGPGSWIHGETGGYLRVCREGRNWFETDFPKWMEEEPKPLTPENRSHEHGSFIIEGLETGRIYRGHFNVQNNGCITNLPDDSIVEVPGYVDRNGMNIPQVGDLPLGCAAVCNASISVQRMSVEAAVNADVELLKQAAMMDPLTGAICTTREISQMVDDMLIAQAEWLPQYASQLDTIKARFESEEKLGTHDTVGAARIKERTVDEIREGKAPKAAVDGKESV